MFFSLEMPRGRPETTGLYSVKRRRARPFLVAEIPTIRNERHPGPGITKTGFRIIYLPPLPHYPGFDR